VPPPLTDDLTRWCREIAELLLLKGEAVVQMLKYHDAQLGVIPSGADGGAMAEQREQDLREFADEAVSSFLKAAEEGLRVAAPWLVVNAAVYLWNYTMHLAEDERVRVLEGPAAQLRGLIHTALELENAHADHNRLVLLDCQLCRVVAEAALLHPDPKLDPVLKQCDAALGALGSMSYPESQGLIKVHSNSHTHVHTVAPRIQTRLGAATLYLTEPRSSFLPSLSNTQVKVSIMRRLNLPPTITTDDLNLKAMFLVETLDEVGAGLVSGGAVSKDEGHVPTSQLVDALLEAGRGSIAAIGRSAPSSLSRTLRMQLLCRAAMHCVSSSEYSAAIALSDRLLQIGRLSTRRSQMSAESSFEVLTFLATAR
jgi:hypothetical protein